MAQATTKRHRVQHIDLLSQTAFWWMMAVVIVLVTVVVIRTGWDLPTGRAPPQLKTFPQDSTHEAFRPGLQEDLTGMN